MIKIFLFAGPRAHALKVVKTNFCEPQKFVFAALGGWAFKQVSRLLQYSALVLLHRLCRAGAGVRGPSPPPRPPLLRPPVGLLPTCRACTGRTRHGTAAVHFSAAPGVPLNYEPATECTEHAEACTKLLLWCARAAPRRSQGKRLRTSAMGAFGGGNEAPGVNQRRRVAPSLVKVAVCGFHPGGPGHATALQL
jgi:hypothetical protein